MDATVFDENAALVNKYPVGALLVAAVDSLKCSELPGYLFIHLHILSNISRSLGEGRTACTLLGKRRDSATTCGKEECDPMSAVLKLS